MSSPVVKDDARSGPLACQVPQSGQLPPEWAGAPLCFKPCCVHLRTDAEIEARKRQISDHKLRRATSVDRRRALQDLPQNDQQPAAGSSRQTKAEQPRRLSTRPLRSLRSQCSPVKTRSRAAPVAQPPPVPVVNNLATRLKRTVSTAGLTVPQDVPLRTMHRTRKPAQHKEGSTHSPFVKSLASKVGEFLVRNSPHKDAVPASHNAPARSQQSAAEQAAVHRSPFSVSLANKLQGFASSLRRSSPVRSASADRRDLTVPKEPLLRTSLRLRESQVKSMEELEEEEMANIRPFKARRLNPLQQSAGHLGVRQLARKEVTQPEPFSFKVEARAQSKAAQAQEMQAATTAVHRYNTRLQQKLTAPKSPMLMTRLRSEAKGGTSIAPQPAASRKQEPLKKAHGLTEPEPFSLFTELRGKYHEQVFQRSVSEMEKENAEARQFKAQPLPKSLDQPAPMPEPERPPLTAAQPFNLRSEARHLDYQAQREWELQKEQEEKRRAAEFKAKPPPDFQHVFVPAAADKPVTVPVEPVFHTELRALDREEFDQRQAERMQKMEDERRARDIARQMEEEQMALEYRKSLVFQAQPMPYFAPQNVFHPLPSSKPLTAARTPDLSFRKNR